MKHLGELVSDLIDGRLDAGEADFANAHLAACPVCRQVVESERLTKARLQALPGPEPAADLASRLLAIAQPAAAGPIGGMDEPEWSADSPAGTATGRPALPAAPPGSRRPAGRTRPGPIAPDGTRRPVRRPGRLRSAAAVAGSVGALSVGLFGLSVVSPSANAALAPTVDMLAVRNVVAMSGLPMLTISPAWRMARRVAGR